MWKVFWFIMFSLFLILCCSGICLSWSVFATMALLTGSLISEAILVLIAGDGAL